MIFGKVKLKLAYLKEKHRVRDLLAGVG